MSKPEVVRYDPAEVLTDRWEMGSMTESADGQYVSVEDYDALATERNELLWLLNDLYTEFGDTANISEPTIDRIDALLEQYK